MATNQISQAKQIATALKAAAKMITAGDRKVTRLTAQLERAQARIAAAKEAKAAARGAKATKAPRTPKAPKLAAEKPTRNKKLAVEEDDDTPVRAKRGAKAAAGKVPNAKTRAAIKESRAMKKVAAKKAAPVAAKKAVAKGPKAKAGKVVKVAKGAKVAPKKSKAGNDDFLLP